MERGEMGWEGEGEGKGEWEGRVGRERERWGRVEKRGGEKEKARGEGVMDLCNFKQTLRYVRGRPYLQHAESHRELLIWLKAVPSLVSTPYT